MDNFHIDITGEGDSSLTKALEIAFAHNAPGGRATHYQVQKLRRKVSYVANPASDHLSGNLAQVEGWHVSHYSQCLPDDDGDTTLVLQWSNSPGAVALPFPLKVGDAVPFVKGWLENTPNLRRKAPDIDGDLGSGWRVFTEDWGHVAGCAYSIIAVQAQYAMYGK